MGKKEKCRCYLLKTIAKAIFVLNSVTKMILAAGITQSIIHVIDYCKFAIE